VAVEADRVRVDRGLDAFGAGLLEAPCQDLIAAAAGREVAGEDVLQPVAGADDVVVVTPGWMTASDSPSAMISWAMRTICG